LSGDIENNEGVISPGNSSTTSSKVPEPGTLLLVVLGGVLMGVASAKEDTNATTNS